MFTSRCYTLRKVAIVQPSSISKAYSHTRTQTPPCYASTRKCDITPHSPLPSYNAAKAANPPPTAPITSHCMPARVIAPAVLELVSLVDVLGNAVTVTVSGWVAVSFRVAVMSTAWYTISLDCRTWLVERTWPPPRAFWWHVTGSSVRLSHLIATVLSLRLVFGSRR